MSAGLLLLVVLLVGCTPRYEGFYRQEHFLGRWWVRQPASWTKHSPALSKWPHCPVEAFEEGECA